MGAEEVAKRVERIREHLLQFAREHEAIRRVERNLRAAAEDERNVLDRMLDDLRQALVDSRPIARRKNPDVSPEEAQALLKPLRAYSPHLRLRAARFLSYRIPPDVPLAQGREREVGEIFERFRAAAEAAKPEGVESKAFVQQVGWEEDFIRLFERHRSAESLAGERLSPEEMQELLRVVARMDACRGLLHLDALAAICLDRISFAPEPKLGNAVLEAQEILSDAFWEHPENL